MPNPQPDAAASPSLSVDRISRMGDTVLVVAGELDLATTPSLDRALRSVDGDIVLDMSGVSFLAASALGTLAAAASRARAAGRGFRLEGLRAGHRRLIAIADLTDTLGSAGSNRSPMTTPGARALPIDETILRRSIEALRHAEVGAGDLEASLRNVVDATRVIFGADGAGLMLIDDGQVLHYVAATDARSAALEAAQEQAGEGPCVDSLVHDEIVRTDDLIADPRWPIVTASIGGLGIRAILGVPIRIGGTAIGSLNTYRDEPHAWHDSEIAAIVAYAHVIEEVLAAALLAREKDVIATQLQHALGSRVVVERAVGVLMAERGVDPVRAFNELRSMARAQRRRVAEIARALLEDPRFAPAESPPPQDR